MTLVVNLYGGPGVGKSTTAAGLFQLLKNQGVNCELVTEYVKEWAWENRPVGALDQFYLFGKQFHRESRLYGKVDVIITDSPLLLCAIYGGINGSPDLHRALLLGCEVVRKEAGCRYLDILLKRNKPYNPAGRFQDEAGARELDVTITRSLDSHLLGDYCVAEGLETALTAVEARLGVGHALGKPTG